MAGTFVDIVNNIKKSIPFAFARYGDGEWLNIKKHIGTNCDGNIYYSELGDELKKIVEVRQDYIMGAQDYNKFKLFSSVNEYPNQDWVDADVLHKASADNLLQPFIDALSTKHIVYIGNIHQKKLEFINEFIEIPDKNVWLHRNKLLQSIENTFDGSHKVYCFSAGMATNVFIDILWKNNNKNTYIDVGSVFDPYVGRLTRKYHHNLPHLNQK